MSETAKSIIGLSIFFITMMVPVFCHFMGKRQEKQKEQAMMDLAHALQFPKKKTLP